MAISKVKTILPLDTYAEIMAIPGWSFNQVTHPNRPQRGGEKIWMQSGYYSDPNFIMGRDDLARQLAVAERKLSEYLGGWVGPTWFCNEFHLWPRPARGNQTNYPILSTKWGWLIQAGQEAWDKLTVNPTPIEYSDTDGDSITDWAKIEFDTYLTIADECQIEVIPPGRDPTAREWRIRPLQITMDAGVLTIQGPKWLFVDPDVWLGIDPIRLDDDPNFLTTVDLYRHYTTSNATIKQARLRWNQDPCAATICDPVCQDACVTVLNPRLGHFYARPAVFASGTFQRATYAVNALPDSVRVWYYAGYVDECAPCDTMPMNLKDAIVQLTNAYLPECPCGRGLTAERWVRSREVMDMDTYDVALAQSAFGTTARGAVFARSVCASLGPIGKGG